MKRDDLDGKVMSFRQERQAAERYRKEKKSKALFYPIRIALEKIGYYKTK